MQQRWRRRARVNSGEVTAVELALVVVSAQPVAAAINRWGGYDNPRMHVAHRILDGNVKFGHPVGSGERRS
ncbi:hypothetical protein PF005_g22314 [Phytophthora fragariae]|uniref:Uncharacterized protein n=2 Tax=Phytophthora TaxID=4783 RepID=A0A6A3E2A0_9STRA|nr:hypothetical protein PF003_g4694 [Phytophthora fragariae]KAE8963800.1 hypothetical protein PR001_g29260 [Phytophthora rubi]KAE8926673.1 hypothetical protein PF009_g23149 [Phytophthora fragariae]KAE8984224.1 hypothetical protein PF011_g20861 [Phytophthora fragariae]KAE9013182.1 hypothetical protein PR002_g14596 [Phytophthora rubi]